MTDPIIRNGFGDDLGSWHITQSGGANGRGNESLPFNPDEQEMFTWISNGDQEWMLEIRVYSNRLDVNLSASHGDSPFTGWSIPLPEGKFNGDQIELHTRYAKTIHDTAALEEVA
jgi:hypothetical protein